MHLLEWFYRVMGKCVWRLFFNKCFWLLIYSKDQFFGFLSDIFILLTGMVHIWPWTLKLRSALFHASDTFTHFTLSFFIYTKTSCCLQVSILFLVSVLFSLVLFCILFKSKCFVFAGFLCLLHDFPGISWNPCQKMFCKSSNS